MNFNVNSEKFDFEKYRGYPKSCYCVASSPRTGSTLLCEFLTASGNAGRPLEYFNDQYISDYKERWHFTDLRDYMVLLQRYRTSQNGYFGIKCHADQYLKCHNLFPKNALFINIYRKDILKQTVSYFKAYISGQYSFDAEIRKNINKDTYRFDDMMHVLEVLININNKWEQVFLSNKNRIKIAYEDLCSDRVSVIKRIEEFLQIDMKNTYAMTPYLKIQYDDLSQYYLESFTEDLARRNIKISYDLHTNCFHMG